MTTPQTPVATSRSLVQKLVSLVKGMDEAALKDLDLIDSVTDGHVEPHLQPSTTEVPGGPGQGMRGGQADTQVRAHSDLHRQDGLTEMYASFNARMGAMQKALSDMAAVVKPIAHAFGEMVKSEGAADKEKDDRDKAANMEREARELKEREGKEAKEAAKKARESDVANALRKARVAVRKAGGAEADDVKSAIEKATGVLKDTDVVIGKAEDDAEDDADEKMTEKARNDLKDLRATLKAQAEAVAKAPQNDADLHTSDRVADKEHVSKGDIQQMLADFAKSQNVSMKQVFDSFAGGTGRSTVADPPVFAKAVAEAPIDAVHMQIETAQNDGLLDGAGFMKATGILSHIQAAKAGHYDMTRVVEEIQASDPSVQRIFNLAIAA